MLDSQLIYFTSSLPLPTSVILDLDKKRRAFLWSGDKTGHASSAKCLVAWQLVCALKELGGLGIKDMGTQDICLLLKLIHRLHCSQTSAWDQWVRQPACIATLTGDIHDSMVNTGRPCGRFFLSIRQSPQSRLGMVRRAHSRRMSGAVRTLW